MPRPLPLPLQPRIKIWFESEGEYAFGFGLCEILSAVREQGSIKTAAESIGRSYRHIWGRIKEAEAILGCPLVQTRVGGKSDHRSELTEEAIRLLESFMTLRESMKKMLEREFTAAFGKK
ncbi:MAG: LysR family transcriptional regulator [Planctomycetaceae bacterium]